MSGSEHLPIAENSEICYVTSLCHFKDFKKIFKMNIFFFFFTLPLPARISVFVFQEYAAFLVLVCWLSDVTVVFLSHAV